MLSDIIAEIYGLKTINSKIQYIFPNIFIMEPLINEKQPKKATTPGHLLVEKWLICGDPDSGQIYTLNINTNKINLETDVDERYRVKVKDAIESIEGLLKLKTGNWLTIGK